MSVTGAPSGEANQANALGPHWAPATSPIDTLLQCLLQNYSLKPPIKAIYLQINALYVDHQVIDNVTKWFISLMFKKKGF